MKAGLGPASVFFLICYNALNPAKLCKLVFSNVVFNVSLFRITILMFLIKRTYKSTCLIQQIIFSISGTIFFIFRSSICSSSKIHRFFFLISILFLAHFFSTTYFILLTFSIHYISHWSYNTSKTPGGSDCSVCCLC